MEENELIGYGRFSTHYAPKLNRIRVVQEYNRIVIRAPFVFGI